MTVLRISMDRACNRRILYSGLLFLYALHFSTANVASNTSQGLTDAQVLERWNKIDKGSTRILQSVVKTVMPYVVRYASELKLSSKCMNDGMLLLNGLRRAQPWAVQFLDSSGKVIDGMLTGTLSSFGSYEECVNTMAKNSHGEVLIKGQYCSINFRPPLPPNDPNFKIGDVPDILKNISKKETIIGEFAKNALIFNMMSLRLGICVPSGCELEDVSKLLKLVGDVIYFNTYVSRCEIKKELKANKAEIISITLYAVFAALIFVGTMMDIYSSRMKVIFNNREARVLLGFSFVRNIKMLLRTDNASGPLSCLHGIRFISTTWVLLSHTYFILNFYSIANMMESVNIGKNFAFQMILNGTFVVETFFCIGGLLVSYHIVSQGRRTISIPHYILHRIWRILPVSAIAITIVFMLNRFGSGPIWHDTINPYIEDCYSNWWSNLIFIQNFYRAENMCLPHTWYIACDIQMYIAALIIFLPLLKWPKAGLPLGFLALFASILYSGVATYINDFPPAMLSVHPDPRYYKRYWAMYFFKPFPHVGSYCIGILAGYLLATKPKLKISWEVQILGWCLSFVFCMSTLFGAFKWNSGEDYATMETVAYASLSRPAWSLGIAWVVVCCATGHGGIVNTILSWKAFVPFGRLSFVVYLLHPFVQLVFIGNKTTLMQNDHFLIVWYFFGHFFVTYALGVLLSMMFEVPLLNLEKILRSRSENNVESKPADVLKGSLQVDKNGCISTIASKAANDTEINGVPGDVVHKL